MISCIMSEAVLYFLAAIRSMSLIKPPSLSFTAEVTPFAFTVDFITSYRLHDFFFASFSIFESVAAPIPRGGQFMIRLQAHIVSLIQDETQVGDNILDLLSLVKTDSTHDMIGDPFVPSMRLRPPLTGC